MNKEILRFTLKLGLICLPVLGFMWLTFAQADGRTDAFYLRFTTPRQSSLIIGSSRAAQGLQPDIIDSVLGRAGLFNYAMTIQNSPYGPEYNQSIHKKLDKNSRDGLFLLEVSPWTLAIPNGVVDDPSKLPESGSALCNPLCTNLDPNPFYLVNEYQNPAYTLFKPGSSELELHANGWLEVNVPMDSMATVLRRMEKLTQYTGLLLEQQKSKTRLEVFETLIKELMPFGQVHLIRMPCHPKMFLIEEQFWPDFNAEMKKIASELHVNYLDFTAEGDQYLYTDGNHLWKECGREFSVELGEMIKKNS